MQEVDMAESLLIIMFVSLAKCSPALTLTCDIMFSCPNSLSWLLLLLTHSQPFSVMATRTFSKDISTVAESFSAPLIRTLLRFLADDTDSSTPPC